MLQAKQMANILFSSPSIAQYTQYTICPPWLLIGSAWFFLLDGLDIGTALFLSWLY